jgi:xanthine/uracil permease
METKRPFARVAASLALWLAFAAVVLFLIPLVTQPTQAATPSAYRLALATLMALGVFVCLVASVLCSLVALLGVRKHGRKDILAPAVVGLVIAVLMLIPVLFGMASGFAERSPSAKARDVVTNQSSNPRPAR